ncbi:hypothetical protein [Flavobacterium sp.]|uniref:hypothetical protein n=1 Tax=Flavobacterium sp. TaxID=239 RepID=UPI0026090638|nr:hypothetical protein [Flavobacterium sp.]
MHVKFIVGLLVLFTNAAFGQKITLNKDGIKAVPISDTRFLPDLNDDITKWAERNFRNGFDFQDRGEVIRIETLRRNAFTYSNLGETYSYHVKVRFTFYLTEGKRQLLIEILNFMDGQEPSSLKVESLFTSKGTVKDEMFEAVKGLEENLQRAVSRLNLQWK